MKENFLHKHGNFFIALAFILFAFYIFKMALLKEVKASETITITILTAITNIIMLIVGYYFGSSKSSVDKQKQLDNMDKDK